MSPALAGGFLTTALPGKSGGFFFLTEETKAEKGSTTVLQSWRAEPRTSELVCLTSKPATLWLFRTLIKSQNSGNKAFSFTVKPKPIFLVCLFFKFLFYIGVQLSYKVMLVSGVQQSDSVIHI